MSDLCNAVPTVVCLSWRVSQWPRGEDAANHYGAKIIAGVAWLDVSSNEQATHVWYNLFKTFDVNATTIYN